MLRGRRPAHFQSVGSEDPIEVIVRAREYGAGDVLVVDVELCGGKRARANSRRYIRGRGRLALLGVVADHLVLLPVWRRTIGSPPGYAGVKPSPRSGFAIVRCSNAIPTDAHRRSLCRLDGSAAAVLSAVYDLVESITSSDDIPRGLSRAAV